MKSLATRTHDTFTHFAHMLFEINKENENSHHKPRPDFKTLFIQVNNVRCLLSDFASPDLAKFSPETLDCTKGDPGSHNTKNLCVLRDRDVMGSLKKSWKSVSKHLRNFVRQMQNLEEE